MRLRWRSKRPVTFKRRDESPGREEDREDYYVWQEGLPDLAVHMPDTSHLSATVYGEEVVHMRLLFYDGELELLEGMGVCIFVPPEASCDYFIKSAEHWEGVQRARLEFIPEGKRR